MAHWLYKLLFCVPVTLTETMGLGIWEIMIGVLILVLLFGASRIPKLARGLGEGVSEFKKGLKEGKETGEGESPEIPPSEQKEKDPEHAE